jgi:two-component system sensor histidine kinase FlrB
VELEELKQAFTLFVSASKKMELSYESLKEQSEALKEELREKNERLLVSLEEKQRLEGFLHGILQNLPVGIVVTNPEGRIRLMNQKALDVLCPGEFTPDGADYTSFEFLQGIPLRFGTIREKRQGRSVYSCSVSSLHGSPDDDSGWVIMLEDMTEISRWKAIAERQKRLTSMGEMAARIAHEIQNPLGSMELTLSLLLEEMQAEQGGYKLACRLASAVRTMSQTLSNLLHFAKGAHPRCECLDMEALVAEGLAFADLMLQEKEIQVRVDHAEQGTRIHGDRILLRQALLNLILNAVEVMDRGGCLQVEVERQRESAGLWTDSPVVRILVRDDGRGIPEEDLDRIFDPFFTTKSRGTGLGLAIVNNIVESHGGVVEVDSQVGEGTCFVISLPCPQEEEHDGYASHPCGG